MTVWYDYTTSMRAVSRNGIAATEWQLGAALAERTSGVRCLGLGQSGRLVELDTLRDLPRALYADPQAVLVPADAGAASGWKGDIKRGLVALLGPESSTTVIRTVVRARLGTARLRTRVQESFRRATNSTTRPPIDGLVGRDDVIVTMGADWAGDVLAAIGAVKRSTGCRVVVMVYDLIPLTHTHLAFHKNQDLFERYYRRVLEVADVATCISEATRRDLTEFGTARGIPMPRTEVIHLGDADGAADPGDAERESFFLWVGTIERRKNFDVLFDALRILESEGADLPTVVVAGSDGWGVDDLLDEVRLRTTAASRALVFLGGVSDDTLVSLYRRAAALVFPSHYEGWGLPLREAATRGCPVAAGDTPASREALEGYDGATLLPTDDPAPWAEYFRRPPAPATPSPRRTWADSVARLVEVIDRLQRAQP